MDYVVELRNICKRFNGINVNDGISFNLNKGEVHALLGENGAGKSTLMSILFGLYTPDSGEIIINGHKCIIDSPNKAMELGIGMVHQHFKLVNNFTVAENIILGMEDSRCGVLTLDAAKERIVNISRLHGLEINPDALVEGLSVGMQQRVEILKMLYRQAEILIFDEPTAMLTPQETEELLKIMQNLTADGKSIILITHKLKEIKKIAGRCTIIRHGRYIATLDVAASSEQQMAELMVGRKLVFDTYKIPRTNTHTLLKLDNLTVLNDRGVTAVKNFSLDIQSGEIVGIAGIGGNGQLELVEAIAGLRTVAQGHIFLNDIDITHLGIKQRIMLGIAHIPEDRQKTGLVLDYNLEENAVLALHKWWPFADNRGILNWEMIASYAQGIIKNFDVRTVGGSKSLARELSGGNQQKLIVGREMTREPDLLIAVQPTRGLDIGSIKYIHSKLIEQRNTGKGVLMISAELDELLDITDRLAVISNGELVATVLTADINIRDIGIMMTGINHRAKSHNSTKDGDFTDD